MYHFKSINSCATEVSSDEAINSAGRYVLMLKILALNLVTIEWPISWEGESWWTRIEEVEVLERGDIGEFWLECDKV